ncbi:MAG: serine/threonine-protein kinase, partial [Myxococcota bacterium]
EILEVIGRGAFGAVYKVLDPRFPAPMALKLSLEPITEVSVAQRALREVTVLKTLTNPHVVRVFDCGLRRDGHAYVLMELLSGKPLHLWHDFDTALAPRTAAHIIYQCCEGLAEAHARGIVHRDLKPENIFVDHGSFTKLLDFGLARSWDDSDVIGARATIGHMVVGTPHYAQPEQLITTELTPAADVYSLAMVFYELLTGHTPFDAERTVSQVIDEWRGKPMRWLQAHARDPAIPLAVVAPGHVSEDLAHVIEVALDKDPKQRPTDARAFGKMLKQSWP